MTTPSSRPPRSWNGEGVASWKVPLLRAEGGEKESQFGLVAPEDGRPTEAEMMILPLTPDEALVVDVARGLDSGSMIEQAHRILMQTPYGVGYSREEGVEGSPWIPVGSGGSPTTSCWVPPLWGLFGSPVLYYRASVIAGSLAVNSNILVPRQATDVFLSPQLDGSSSRMI